MLARVVMVVCVVATTLAAVPSVPSVPSSAPPRTDPSAADLAGVRPLWEARWIGADGVEHVGVTGEGVAVFSAEPYDALHADLDQCDDGVHHAASVQIINVPGVIGPVPFPKGDSDHGEIIAGVLCGDGEMSDGRYAGIAPDSTVFASFGFCPDDCNIASWFDEPSLRVYTWSLSSDRYEEAFEKGYTEDDDLLFVAAAGNSGGDGTTAETMDFLREHEEVVGVAAADAQLDGVAFFSSRGAKADPRTWPDITAPSCMVSVTPYTGVESYAIGTHNYLVEQAIGTDACPDPDPVTYAQILARSYTLNTGTSLAAPVVAGVAVLMAEVNPDLTSADLRYLLTRTASPFLPSDDLDGDGEVSPAEFREQHGWEAGWGLVDAEAAVAAAHWALLHPSASLDEAIACSHTATVDGTLVLNPDGTCVGS